MAARLTDAQKRRRAYARHSGKEALKCIRRAVEHQQDAHWYTDRPGYGTLAATWQVLSDQAVDHAAANARRAARWVMSSWGEGL